MRLRWILAGFAFGVLLSAAASCGSGKKRCDASTCASGCCDVNGDCQPGVSNGACGSAAGACVACLPNQVCQLGLCTPLGTGGGTGGPGQDGGRSDGGADAGVHTWYRDALPIVQARCQGCHVAGGIAPFALTTYAEARDKHQAIAAAVASRSMPPWHPSEGCQTFKGSRRLSQREVDTLVGWSAGGALEGNPADAPPPPDAGAGLPWVSAELQPGSSYTPDGGSRPDDYHCFILDPALTQHAYVIGVDIQPGVRPIVHHVVLFDAARADAQARDNAEPGPGWTCFGGPGTPNPAVVGAWVPGTGPTQYPAGTGIRIAAGRVLVMQVHYNVSSAPAAPDRTVARLQYAQSPVRAAYIAGPVHTGLRIPPNAFGHTESASYTAPANVTVYGALPHMHTKGKRIRVEKRSGGNSTCLIDIPQWDFHWQQFYFYDSPATVPVAQGDELIVSCTWDNPTNREVTWGEGTDEEMCAGMLYVTVP